jgi:alpha-beta hydrolase superfamily lysophospholipase
MLIRIFRKLLVIATVLALLWFGAALVMVFFWPAPKFTHSMSGVTVNSTQAVAADPSIAAEAARFQMRDGAVLRGRRFASDAPATVLFLHGVMSSSEEYLETCRQIHDLTGAEVIALNLRGHGESDGAPGDIRYIGQYEDDVADVIATLRQRKPGSRIILAGHSMGGGIVMRYAETHEVPAADGYLLFAPHLGIKSPTMRTEPAQGHAAESETLMKLNLPRTIGLVMLNAARVRGLNGLPTLLFNVPTQYPIHTYSFRAMVSMTPVDYAAALTADAKPLLVIVGGNDEAFHAERFASIISLHQHGQTMVIEGESHDSIVRSSAALRAASVWML